MFHHTLETEERKDMQREVIKCLDNMIRRNRRILLVGDFNCKKVNQREMEVMDNAGQWSEKVIQLTIVNAMDQWVEESTRYKREEESSLLDLVFTKKPESPPIIQYHNPMARSDHVTLEMQIQEEDEISYREDYKG
ncbi:hypothetical protein E2C01_052439 [Portunus trituberculatus]|uniref:Endonuclease/exonuclease/phosphatase domain-containing protein n=1 Tax=Portunus trituberculatus TaxID=210409 RepID=A0A5B7GPC8_PORTR|nr:hypothetical protein [Portunus trituberculatus]